MSTVVAVFDLDGTLVRRGSLVAFVRHLAGTPGLVTAAVAGVRRIGLPPERGRFKEGALGAVLRDRPEAEVRARGREFADGTLRGWLHAGTVDRLHHHRDEGHRLVLLTAALDVYAEPFATAVGIDEVISTRVVTEGGRCTGCLAGGQLTGSAKVEALRRRLTALELDCPGLVVHAYGNSGDDRPLLAWARSTRAT